MKISPFQRRLAFVCHMVTLCACAQDDDGARSQSAGAGAGGRRWWAGESAGASGTGGGGTTGGAAGTGPAGTAGGGGMAGAAGSGGASSECVFDEPHGSCKGPSGLCCPMKGSWVKLVPSTGCCTLLGEPNKSDILGCGSTVPLDTSGMGCVSTASLGCYSSDQPGGATLLALVDSENWRPDSLGPTFHGCSVAEVTFNAVFDSLAVGVEACPGGTP